MGSSVRRRLLCIPIASDAIREGNAIEIAEQSVAQRRGKPRARTLPFYRAMTRPKTYLFIASVIVIIIVLTIILLNQAHEPQFRFISSQSHRRTFVQNTRTSENVSYFYTFPADYNTVCNDAAMELGYAGDKKTTSVIGQETRVRNFFTDFSQHEKLNQKYMIQIMDGIRLSDEPLTYSNYKWVAAPGCVTVGLYRRDKKFDIWQFTKDLFK